MWRVRALILLHLVCAVSSAQRGVYYAELSPLGGAVAVGSAAVFLHGSDGQVGFTGMVHDVEPSLNDALCSAPNGCGAHIHAGKSCDSVETQMGHFYNNASVQTDPWLYERYYSDASGHGLFGSVINIGTSDVDGRAFIIHSSNGTRIACGLLAEAKADNLFTAMAEALVDSKKVTADVTFFVLGGGGGGGVVYMSGLANGLEPNLQGPPNGTDCTAVNGCGVHIHSGTSCDNVTTQGGHLWNNESLTFDPWTYVFYNTTDAEGMTHFAKTVDMGPGTSINGRAFIVHANNGSRVSCGILSSTAPATSGAPSLSDRWITVRKGFAFAVALAFLWLG